ncbi:MAG: AEC family transporter [Liquorilactobacillus ghanensis]|uniref:AEC family transporter n=1 Tax=Liquorilactobacillus ghanensis TaxID=399370 RepID=UPI0039E8A55A
MSIVGLTGQIFLMFILMAVGFLANKINFLHAQTSDDLTNILLTIIGPCLIVKAFEQPYSADRAQLFLLVGLAVVISYFIQILLSQLIFRKTANQNVKNIARYSSVYPNVGFLGIPLASSLFGNNGVFFAVVSMAVFNIFNWSHGVSIFHKKSQNFWSVLRQIVMNPNIIAIIIGLLIFFFSLHVPTILNQAITYISNANTPMSMIVVGSSLANSKLNKESFSRPIITSLALRNIIYPLITLVILLLMNINGTAFSVSLLLAACPAASLGVLFTLQIHQDASPAVSLMSLSTIFSLLTIPLVFSIASLF